MSEDAYRRTRAIIESPRAIEHRLIGEITGEMIKARDAGLKGVALMPALDRNRQVWGVFSAVCSTPGNQLSAPLRAGIVSLALWVERYTSDVVRGRESIDDLITINRTVMDGLALENLAA